MDFALKQFLRPTQPPPFSVSILVLMDFALKLGRYRREWERVISVSILVLMDFALKPDCGKIYLF